MEYRLPNHPSSLISDPLSILDSEELQVPYWEFLKALLKPMTSSIEAAAVEARTDIEEGTSKAQNVEFKRSQRIHSMFFDALDTIACSLSPTTRTQDFSLLRSQSPDLLPSELIHSIIQSALQLPTLLPSGYLPILGNPPTGSGQHEKQQPAASASSTSITLSSDQINCLICHMLLGTLPTPPWPDASWEPSLAQAWFADDGRGDREIKNAYIKVLLTYLGDTLRDGHDQQDKEGQEGEAGLGRTGVTYRLVEYPSIPRDDVLFASLSNETADLRNKPLVPLTVCLLDEEDDDCEHCFGIEMKDSNTSKESSITTDMVQLISANKEVGFGPAATQEERLFGAVPCLLPIVLFTPPLSPTQGVLVSGNGTAVYARFKGHLRTAKLDTIYSSPDAQKKGRSFLFLDALEMDGESHGRDRELELMKRELRKLITGFGALEINEQSGKWRSRARVVVPPWGCGTFGGDLRVKLLLIWLSASIVSGELPSFGDQGQEDGDEKEEEGMGALELRFSLRQDIWNQLDPEWRHSIQSISRFRLRVDGNENDVAQTTWNIGRFWDEVSSGKCLLP
ncbi:hypothetical protein FRC17_003683 [Serendipita sp. 399]|nr:hypothetical protein FRC17_003683 [Serendipita sp. 399]